MTTNIKIKSGLSGLSVPKALIKCKAVLIAMRDNSNFPTPSPSLGEIQGNMDIVATIEGEIALGNNSNIMLRNTTMRMLKLQMTALAAYCNSVAMGNVAMLETTGFDFSKAPAPTQRPGVIDGVTAVNTGQSGEVRVSWKGDSSRNNYKVESATNPSGEWRMVCQPTKTSCEIEGLTTGQWAYFRVCAVNNGGTGEWSDVSKVMVA